MLHINDFRGQLSNAEPADLPSGSAQEQRNVSTHYPGRLTVRKGIQPATFSSSSTISSSAFHTFQRLCFAKTRFGDLIGVNGLERGFRWDGVTANVEEIGLTAPTAAPTIAASYVSGQGGAITNVADDGSGEYRITSATHGLSTGQQVTIYNVVATGDQETDLNGQEFTITVIDANNFDLDGTAFQGTYTTGGNWVLSGAEGAISSVTNNTTYRITTSSSHGLIDGMRVTLNNIIGSGGLAADLNGKTFEIENASGSVFDLVGTTFQGTYTSGGSWAFSAVGGASDGEYSFYYRYIDDTSDPVPSNLSPARTILAKAGQTFAWSGIPSSFPDARETQAELWRTTAGETNVVYRITTLNEGTTSFSTDDSADATLLENDDDDIMLINLDDGSLNANRFELPPDDRPYVVMFQDRYWYAGEVRYNEGTVATDGTTALVGSGTSWTTEMADRYIDIDGETAPIKISSVTDATNLVLESAAATTASGKSYAIYPDPADRRKLRYSEVDEPESVPGVNVVTIQENTGDDDVVTGLMPRGRWLFIFTQRHRYLLTFARQPNIDASIVLVDDRGLFNHWCWAFFEDTAYCMDDVGPYAWKLGGRGEPIGTPIQDLWRKDGQGEQIDFTKSDKFHVEVDRIKEKVYFFVAFVNDSGTLPTRALVYNVRRGTWDVMEYPIQIGGLALAQVSSETRLLAGAEAGNVYLVDEGTTDVVTSETRGTATSATSNTLTDTSASFDSTMVGARVGIYEGTGKGQVRTISSQTSTQLTVSANWDTTPDTTSKYIVGCIEWLWKSKDFDYSLDEDAEERKVGVDFTPTSGDTRLDLRLYQNNISTPETLTPQKFGDAVEILDANLTDVVMFLQLARSAIEDSVGYEEYYFAGMRSKKIHTDKSVALELRGFQGDDAVEINEVIVGGVEG